MAYKSEMARARAGKRRSESEQRRALKFKMDGYNRLSNKSRSKPEDFSYNGEKTTHDIIQELDAVLHSQREQHKRSTFVDKIMADITCPEVKDYWRSRIAKGGIKF